MITKEQFGEWRHHPATKFFWAFLRDRKKALTNETYEIFIRGKFGDAAHVHRGQILEVTLFEELTFDSIKVFYEELNAGSGSGTKNGQPGPD